MGNQAKGCKELFDEVIDKGLCALCGACAGSCPYLVSYRGRIVQMDDCTVEDSQCYKYCPRTYMDMDALSQQVFGVPYNENELGIARQVLMVRSTDARIKEKAQYGGTVTTLLSLAMAEGLVDNVVLTRTTDDKTPGGFLARNVEEILQCAGSSYMACPILETYNRIPEDEDVSVGIVGVPCQILALAKMKKESPEHRPDINNVKLTIGLFCTWALSPDGFLQFLGDNLNLSHVTKFDIPPPPANVFDAYTPSGKASFSLDLVRKFRMLTCAYCLDMTSEFADISVGSVEGIEGWNTVIIRTDAGAELMEMAKAKGKVETDTLPSQNLAHLKEASLLKKKRALAEIVKRTGDKKNLLYVGLSPSLAGKLLA